MLNNPPQGALSGYGNYTGNDTANRAIPHGLTERPRWVFITENSQNWFVTGISGRIIYIVNATAPAGQLSVTEATASNFYVGNAGSYTNSANANGVSYSWVAIA